VGPACQIHLSCLGTDAACWCPLRATIRGAEPICLPHASGPDFLVKKILQNHTCVQSAKSGERTLFWYDRWIDGQSTADLAPDLLNFVRPKSALLSTVAQARLNNAWIAIC
jgi:hypothetical protein